MHLLMQSCVIFAIIKTRSDQIINNGQLMHDNSAKCNTISTHQSFHNTKQLIMRIVEHINRMHSTEVTLCAHRTKKGKMSTLISNYVQKVFLGTKFVKLCRSDINNVSICAKITVQCVLVTNLCTCYDDTIPDILQRQAFTISIFLSLHVQSDSCTQQMRDIISPK